MFEERKKSLLLDQKTAEENLRKVKDENGKNPEKLEKFLELVGSAWLSHEAAFPEEKREMVTVFTSNRQIEGKKVELKPSIPFQEIANRFQNIACDPERTIPRIWDSLLDSLAKLNTCGELPDLSALSGFKKYDETASEAKE